MATGRSLHMIPPQQRPSWGKWPSVFSYAGFMLIGYGAISLGIESYLYAVLFIGGWLLVSFPLQILAFRIVTGLFYEEWVVFNPELAEQYKSPRLSKNEPSQSGKQRDIDLEELRTQFRGRPYALLIQHHIRRQDTQQLQFGSLGTIEFLPPMARHLAEDFIDRWNLRAYDHELWQTDCSTVFDEILADAREILEATGAPTDDKTLFNMFQIVTLSYAYSASDQPKMRKFIGIRKGLFRR